MDIIIYKELINLIKNNCKWAIVEDKLYENENELQNSYKINSTKALLVRFRIDNGVAESKNTLPIWEWNLEKALLLLETDKNFKHRVKMHACTPEDADRWLQIAVFGNIIFK